MAKSTEEWKLPQGRSLRLKGHNYAGPASYFLTIRSEHHEPVFEMPELRGIVEEGWKALPARFPHVRLDSYIVMPDHMHSILHVVVNKEKVPPLGSVIGAYKSLTTNAWLEYVKTHNISWSGNLWQDNFNDHVIRDNRDLVQKREYIRLNPIRWEQYPNRYS
ncbi:MAG TPA: transposase [Ktedonobacteraceae bacterium]|nr:transposase [Ktedonobacteraceae bacterium]